jgi:hypothetical protein
MKSFVEVEIVCFKSKYDEKLAIKKSLLIFLLWKVVCLFAMSPKP